MCIYVHRNVLLREDDFRNTEIRRSVRKRTIRNGKKKTYERSTDYSFATQTSNPKKRKTKPAAVRQDEGEGVKITIR